MSPGQGMNILGMLVVLLIKPINQVRLLDWSFTAQTVPIIAVNISLLLRLAIGMLWGVQRCLLIGVTQIKLPILIITRTYKWE